MFVLILHSTKTKVDTETAPVRCPRRVSIEEQIQDVHKLRKFLWRCPSLRRSSSRRPRRLVELVLSWYILLARPLSRREGGTCLLWTSGSQSAAGTHRSIEVLTANKSTWTCSTSAPTSLVGCLVQLGVVRSRQTARQELQVRAEPPHPPSPHSLIDPGGTGCPP